MQHGNGMDQGRSHHLTSAGFGTLVRVRIAHLPTPKGQPRRPPKGQHAHTHAHGHPSPMPRSLSRMMMMIFGAALLRARDTGSDQHEGDNVIVFQCRFFHAAHDLRAHSHRLDIDNKEHAWTGVARHQYNIHASRMDAGETGRCRANSQSTTETASVPRSVPGT